MAEYTRARSTIQKQERMLEIMSATEKLFSEQTYHNITLTTIAKSLHWSRSNLYKYVTAKEEIFLELYLKKQRHYFNCITNAFENEVCSSDSEKAELVTDVLFRNQDFLRYFSILSTIIETNVSVVKLAQFKKQSTDDLQILVISLSTNFQIPYDLAMKFHWILLSYASGIINSSVPNHVLDEALKLAGIPKINISFHDEIKDFIMIYLKGCNTSL
ncbi:MAG: TetR family transcriptional regulator [Lachnospiraceae bacterium]